MPQALIVDDNDINLRYLDAVLGSAGYEVESACDGAEALAKARHAPPDVIITDLLMPVMDGYALLREWQADLRLRAIPFVVYTATYTEVEDKRLALTLGAAAFIRKPAESTEILARLRELSAALPAHSPLAAAARNETVELRGYNQALVRKLERKMLQLEETNRALQHEMLEHRMATEALRVSEERFRQLADNSQEVFWMTDASRSQVLYVSPAYETIWGRSCASLYAAPCSWFDTLSPEDRGEVEAAARAAEKTHGPYQLSYRITRPDGSLRWIRDRVTPIRDSEGRVHRLAGTTTDVTEQRQLEMQLQQAQKMESVGQLAGGIAHDFNNLLTIINGVADLAISGLGETDPLRPDLEQIRSAGERGAAMTRQLLALSRRQILTPEVINLGDVVGGMLGLLKRLIGEDIKVVYSSSEGLGAVNADPRQIEQIILNLVVNARDAMPDGGTLFIDIRDVELDQRYVAEHRASHPGPHIRLTVSDTGIGMDEVTRVRVFEPFFTTKPVGRGTGLGLSTVYGIVKQSEGSVDVESEPGKGATFTVHLPRVNDVPLPRRPASPEPPPPGTETILVVEDEPGLLELAQRILKSAGYTLLDAHNAGEALLRAEQHGGPIHLMLADVIMPGINGRALAAQLAAVRPQMRVLYTSGYADDAILRHGVLDNVNCFIAKPYTPVELRRKVREVLDA